MIDVDICKCCPSSLEKMHERKFQVDKNTNMAHEKEQGSASGARKKNICNERARLHPKAMAR